MKKPTNTLILLAMTLESNLYMTLHNEIHQKILDYINIHTFQNKKKDV